MVQIIGNPNAPSVNRYKSANAATNYFERATQFDQQPEMIGGPQRRLAQ